MAWRGVKTQKRMHYAKCTGEDDNVWSAPLSNIITTLPDTWHNIKWDLGQKIFTNNVNVIVHNLNHPASPLTLALMSSCNVTT